MATPEDVPSPFRKYTILLENSLDNRDSSRLARVIWKTAVAPCPRDGVECAGERRRGGCRAWLHRMGGVTRKDTRRWGDERGLKVPFVLRGGTRSLGGNKNSGQGNRQRAGIANRPAHNQPCIPEKQRIRLARLMLDTGGSCITRHGEHHVSKATTQRGSLPRKLRPAQEPRHAAGQLCVSSGLLAASAANDPRSWRQAGSHHTSCGPIGTGVGICTATRWM
jgi:hypothetical protein